MTFLKIMHVLLHLDPLLLSRDFASHRIPVFIQIALSLLHQKHKVFVYASKEFKSIFETNVSQAIFLEANNEILQNNLNHDLNNAIIYVNQLNYQIENLIISDILSKDLNPDFLISIGPTTILRKIWPNKLFLHYELGIFNRPPFPVHHQFDPGGYYHKSILSKYPNLNKSMDLKSLAKMDNLKNHWLNKLNLTNSVLGKLDCIYAPLPSFKNWTVRTEISYINRYEYLKVISEKYYDKQIICNEKPQDPLTSHERTQISKLKNVKFIENKDIYGIGNLLVMHSKTTYTFSPSLSLQVLFWGNNLLSHIDSSMYAWAIHPQAREQLAGYFEIFNIQNFAEIDKRIDIWNSFNPYL